MNCSQFSVSSQCLSLGEHLLQQSSKFHGNMNIASANNRIHCIASSYLEEEKNGKKCVNSHSKDVVEVAVIFENWMNRNPIDWSANHET